MHRYQAKEEISSDDCRTHCFHRCCRCHDHPLIHVEKENVIKYGRFFQHYVNVMHVLSFILAYALRTGSKSEPWIKTKRRRFTYSEVLGMTKNLQQPLGEGAFGIVYHGNLNGSEQVAVKLLLQTSAQGYKEFKAEV